MKPVSLLAAGVAACLLSAAPAQAREVAYHYAPLGAASTYLVDWKGSDRARVVGHLGAAGGSVAPHGGGKLITLDPPISVDYPDQLDECGQTYTLRWTQHQLMVHDDSNRLARLVEIGQTVRLGGCQDGLTEHFGDPDDPGLEHVATPFAKRPPVNDIVPGVVLAGLSEEPVFSYFLGTDLATLQAGGTIRFESTGHVFPASVGADQWLEIQLPGGPRAYTRLTVDDETGAEMWLQAERAGGKAQRVAEVLVVKPAGGAGFGSVAKASRIWEWGLFKDLDTPGETWLYRDGSGERVSGGVRSPIQSWFFQGADLVQVRQQAGLKRERYWVPLMNRGPHRWVMESEWWTRDGAEPELMIAPRVALFTDLGKAVRPAPPAR